MPEKELLSLRFPAGTRDRLKMLSDGDSLTKTILRAIEALEDQNLNREDLDWITRLRFESIEARLAALEEGKRVAQKSSEKPVGQRSSLVTSQQYPDEIKILAVKMKSEGSTNAEIINAIEQEVGRAPDSKNIAKLLKLWASTS